jgi:peptide/nickel transport system substrate-binding protein/oligopeptide transport system substrate-binding protein
MFNLLTAVFALFLTVPLSAETYRFTVHFSPSRISWNPHSAYTTTEAQIFTALYEGLVSFHPATLRPIPGAAESWTVSDNNTVITFTLRKGLTWSNGESLTAADFRDSWLTLLSPNSGNEYGSLLDDITGAREYRTGNGNPEDVGVSVIDERTLEVRLMRPSPQFLSILCHYSFVPVHRDFRNVPDWSAHRSVPVNGPYVIRARNPGEVLLDKNPEYWDRDKVAVEGLKLLFTEDSDTLMKDFNRFAVDWIISGMDTSQLAVREALNIGPLFSTTYFYFSNSNRIFSNPDVRRALALLVPWEELKKGRLIPAVTLVPPIPNYPASSAGFPKEEGRLAEALSLLEKAGYPGGKGLPNPSIRVPSEDPIALAMKEAWQVHLGLETVIEIVEFPEYYESVKEGGYDLATLSWTGDYADPFTFLGMWDSRSSFNDAGFADSRYDSILDESATLGHLPRLVKLREAEDILLTTCQVLPVEHYPAVNIIDRRFVDGWYPNALDIHPFKDLVSKLGFNIPGVAMVRD